MSTRAELGIKSTMLSEQLMPDGIKRQVHCTGAYDLRPHPKNYGIHGMELLFVVRRSGCVVSWNWMLPLHLPHVARSLDGKPYTMYDGLGDIGIHSPVALYDGQSCLEDCQFTGGKCYPDGTSLGAMELWKEIVGDPTLIWPKLEERLLELEQRVLKQQEDEKRFS